MRDNLLKVSTSRKKIYHRNRNFAWVNLRWMNIQKFIHLNLASCGMLGGTKHHNLQKRNLRGYIYVVNGGNLSKNRKRARELQRLRLYLCSDGGNTIIK